jgi:hypothetical protein
MMWAGEKKWNPQTHSGRLVTAAMASTSSVEVLVARIAPDFATVAALLGVGQVR